MYIPEKMMENVSKKPLSISNAMDKIRVYLEMDKYAKERKQIGKDWETWKKKNVVVKYLLNVCIIVVFLFSYTNILSYLMIIMLFLFILITN